MRFRTKHIADSVVERIQAAANHEAPPTAARGSSTIQMQRDQAGNLAVTKTFENGATEVMTISNTAPVPPDNELIPVVDDGMDDAQPGVAADQGGIVENAALGGDAINSLLRQ